MKTVWIDRDLLDNKSGIGKDSKFMMEWLSSNFLCKFANWPMPLTFRTRLRRGILLVLRLVFGEAIHLPSSYRGAFYQSQLGPLLPGRGIEVWIVRLHDIFPITNPEWFRWWAVKIFQRSLSLAVRRQAIFLCDSRSTENEVRKLYKGQNLNTFVIPCFIQPGLSANCGSCDACMDLQVILKSKYFLSVGTIEPRKNYQLALSTWENFDSSSDPIPNLIIVGRPGWKTKKLQMDLRQGACNKIIWFSNCCDGSLETLYSHAEALISFSFAEGFDLPPMEARQKYKKPLILSDIPVHREFHNDVALFFSSKSELLEILQNPLKISSISGYEDSSHFDLKRVTKLIMSML